ncbi:MAG: DNA-binding protein [Thermodesulfovibrionales bacterium]|nr:DNA-binding protein [Thermodesulfovibrionales bacterium]
MKKMVFNEVLQGRLNKGDDIIEGLTRIITQNHIVAGVISAIGAVSKARIGYFDQEKKTYEEKEFEEPMEVLSLTGNISLKDGLPFAHLHIVLSKRDYSVIGGHLYNGTIVYALEYQIVPFYGGYFKRQLDDETGLYLWEK